MRGEVGKELNMWRRLLPDAKSSWLFSFIQTDLLCGAVSAVGERELSAKRTKRSKPPDICPIVLLYFIIYLAFPSLFLSFFLILSFPIFLPFPSTSPSFLQFVFFFHKVNVRKKKKKYFCSFALLLFVTIVWSRVQDFSLCVYNYPASIAGTQPGLPSASFVPLPPCVPFVYVFPFIK